MDLAPKSARRPPNPIFDLARKMPRRYSQMERVQAARAFINQAGPRDGGHQADMELHAFMALFHPEVPVQTVREMSRDIRRR